MILTELRNQLRRRRRASLMELSLAFAVPAEALRGMLARLEAKGLVRRKLEEGACGGCTRCDSRIAEIYEWTGG